MARSNPVLARVRAICLSLPDTKETPTWGQPHFRVGEKIFAGCGEEKGRLSIGFKLEMKHAREIVKDPRFSPAPYVGHKGWVSMDGRSVSDWDEVRDLILESYELIAPKKSLAKLAGGTTELAEPEPPMKAKPAKKRAKASR
jgi:predicted DNA-binding protein (MmcQ/YjbR family)